MGVIRRFTRPAPLGFPAAGLTSGSQAGARSRGLEPSGAMPFPGADSIFSSFCGFTWGLAAPRPREDFGRRGREPTRCRRAVYHILGVRRFRGHTIPGRGFNLFKPLRRHLRANPRGDARLAPRGDFVGRFGRNGKAPPLGCDETVMAIERAHNLDDAIDSLKVGPRHRVKGYQERLVETAQLHREELGGRLGHAASENASNQRAHALLANVLPLRDHGDRHAAVRTR
jgi:hypothetical protein